MTEGCGTVQGYWNGCRCIECRVQRSVYEKLYRERRRQGLEGLASGYRTSLELRTLKSEGYWPGKLSSLLGLSRVTLWRHQRSCPVRAKTATAVRRFWSRVTESGEAEIDAERKKVAEGMLNTLGRDFLTHGSAWQTLPMGDEETE